MTAKQNDSRTRVFVYGTLKAGYGNHALLEEGDAEFISSETLRLPYRMVDLGWYPGVCPVADPSDSDLYDISGEVYDIPEQTLYSLDLLEGYPSYYDRVKVVTPHGKAWMYFLPTDYMERCTLVEGGEWG